MAWVSFHLTESDASASEPVSKSQTFLQREPVSEPVVLAAKTIRYMRLATEWSSENLDPTFEETLRNIVIGQLKNTGDWQTWVDRWHAGDDGSADQAFPRC